MLIFPEKAHSSEEKFKKMKDVYAKLREEHIEALKKNSTLQKDLDGSKKSQSVAEAEKLVKKCFFVVRWSLIEN